MPEALDALLRVNLALAVAVAGVMAVRLPVRRWFGARITYSLWILPSLAALAMLAPVRVVTISVPTAPAAAQLAGKAGAAPLASAPFDTDALLVGLWLAGMVASLAWLAWRQLRFVRAARAGRAGPAVVGVFRPRVVTPSDFEQVYTPRERAVVLAHEQAHLDHRDPPVNAALALLACACWFNPAIHVMAFWLRIDQELACDARVVAAFPNARRVYAEAMLKTQLAARPLPLGCHWASHPLAQRVKLLSRPAPSRTRRRLGLALTLTLALSGAVGGWSLRPARIVLQPAPIAVRPAPSAPQLLPPPPAPPPRPVAPKPAPASRVARAAVAAPVLAPSPVAVETPAVIAPAPPPSLRPLRIVHAIADRSRVQPGSAVRVVASGLAPDGVPLWADFTAFGSQQVYRKGAYERGGSRYSLFTSVVQHGERLLVTVSLGREFRPQLTGAIELAPGETGVLRLPTGQPVVVTATVRPETPDEIEEGRRLQDYADSLAIRWG